MRKMLAAAVVFAGVGGLAGSGWSATFYAWGSPADSADAVTITNLQLVSPYDPAGAPDCVDSSISIVGSCNPTKDISTYIPTGASNPSGGSSPAAEEWYLSQLINSALTGTTGQLTSGPAGGTSFTNLDTWVNGTAWTYLLLKYDAEWVWLEITDRFVSVSGLPNGISHWALYNPVPIPLPAAAWMLLAGLAVLFGVGGARKRQAATAA